MGTTSFELNILSKGDMARFGVVPEVTGKIWREDPSEKALEEGSKQFSSPPDPVMDISRL